MRTILTVAAAILGPTPAPRVPITSGTIVTANMTAGTASVIDVETGRSVATLPTGGVPHEATTSHDGNWAVISVYGNRTEIGHSLLVIDVRKAAIARTIELGDLTRPHGVRFLPGDRQLVLTSEASNRIAVIDFATGAVDTTIATGEKFSHMIAVTPDGRRAFVTNVSPGSISAFDLTTSTRTGIHPVGTLVEGIAVTPDGREVWAGGNQSQQVHVLDTKTGTVSATIGGFGMAYRIAITPDGRQAVVSDPGNEKIHLVDVGQRAITTTIDIPAVGGQPASPQGVTISPDGSTALVTLKQASQVVLVDLALGQVVRTLATGGGSDGVAFSPVVAAPR